MSMRIVGIIIVGSVLGFCKPVFADLKSDVLGCLQKQNNTDRLDCYDTVVKYYKGRPSMEPTPPLPVVEAASSPKNNPLVVPVNAQTEHKVVVTQVKRKLPEDTFGKAADGDLESIQSRMIGEFKGWEKGMKLKLENGQVWKVTSRKAGYKKMTNPMIIISRGFFGSFNAKVEGLNASAKVKRIK